MIHIGFDPSQLTGNQKAWWTKWQKRADKATKKAIDTWEQSKDKKQISFNQKVWADLKKWLLDNIFHGKCAYCETKAPRFTPDAEHYRPKGGVDYRDKVTGALTVAQTKDENGQQADHPGYFWLAYHWKNLVPSCEFCNSGHGKQNQFPVEESHVLVKRLTAERVAALRERPYKSNCGQDVYYLQPDDLDTLEEPLLLHPYRDRPEEHIAFQHGGVVVWTSPKGEHTIGICKLSEEDLRQARQEAQDGALPTFGVRYVAELQNSPGDPKMAYKKAWEWLKDVTTGKAQYSAAVRVHIEQCFPEPD